MQNLSSKAGRTAAPTQPMESAVIGGTPDQAKMAGSSANLQKSTQLSVEGKQSLPTYLRELTGARSLTETEQERMGRAQNMGQLNSLEGRVESMAQAAAAATPTGTATLSVNDPALVSKINDPVARATAHNLLVKVAAGDTDVDYKALATLLGYDAPTDAKSLTDIANDIKKVYLSDPAASIGKAASAGTPDELFVGSLDPKELGFQSFSELATLLKLPANTDFTKFTIRQLTDQVSKIQAEEYSRTSSLMRLLSDPNVGAAEKEAARAQLSQLGATGILSAEADVSNLAEQADNINSVKIGDETFTISELLSDKHITGIVAGALEDPAKLAALKLTQPGLADWIETNKTGLEKVVGKIDPAIKVLGDTVTANNKLATPDGATKVSDNAMTILFGANWKTTLNTLTPPPLYAALSDTTIPVAARQSLTNLINSMSSRPDDLNYLKTLTQKSLSDKGLLTADGITKYINYLNSSQVLAGFDPANTAPESVLSAVFGTDDMQELNKVVAQVKLLNDTNLGEDLSGGLLDILDKNHDGAIDDINTIVETAKSFFSGKSVRDLLKGTDGTPDVADGPGLLKAIRASISTAQQDPLYKNYVGADNKGVLADGKIDDADVGRLSTAPLEDLQKMIDKGVPGAGKLQNTITQRVKAETSTAIDSISKPLGSFMRGAIVSSEDIMTGLKAAWETIQSGSFPTNSQVVKDSITQQFKTLVQKQRDSIQSTFTKEIENSPDRKALETVNANWEASRVTLTAAEQRLAEVKFQPGQFTSEERNRAEAAVKKARDAVEAAQRKANIAGHRLEVSSGATRNKYQPILDTLAEYK
jgi:hypothetical protein